MVMELKSFPGISPKRIASLVSWFLKFVSKRCALKDFKGIFWGRSEIKNSLKVLY